MIIMMITMTYFSFYSSSYYVQLTPGYYSGSSLPSDSYNTYLQTFFLIKTFITDLSKYLPKFII
jgi:hypothetical protein